MFLNSPGNPSKPKKAAYLIAATFLGIILSFITHAFIEIGYLSWAEKQNQTVIFYNHCALPPLLQNGLLVFGTFGGFFLGRYWWRKVYVERAWSGQTGSRPA